MHTHLIELLKKHCKAISLSVMALNLAACSQVPTTTSNMTTNITTALSSIISPKVEIPEEKKEEKDAAPVAPQSIDHVANAVPKAEPASKYGNPATYKVFGKTYHVKKSSAGYSEKGLASWYGTKFHGRRTSSGEPYDIYSMTAAHKTLPLPTYAKVKNLKNGKEIIVKINDRGPFVGDRIIDLSYAAAKKLGVYETGTARVEVVAINPKTWGGPDSPLIDLKDIPSADVSEPLFIQLGAFKSKSNAEKLVSKVKALAKSEKHDLIIHESQGKDGALYKVRLGPLKSSKQVDMLRGKIAAANLPHPTVVSE